jgi:hypothetical protein
MTKRSLWKGLMAGRLPAWWRRWPRPLRRSIIRRGRMASRSRRLSWRRSSPGTAGQHSKAVASGRSTGDSAWLRARPMARWRSTIRRPRSRGGATFGLTLLALTHETALPAMGLEAKLEEQTPREHASEAATHVVYGVVAERVRRLARRVLG